jgi:hypothetical protein
LLAPGAAAPNDSAVTTPPDQPDPWATGGGATPPPGYPQQPGWGAPPGGAAPPPPPGYPPQGFPPQGQPPYQPQPGWPQQGQPGDWSAPGYGTWGAPQRNNGMGTAALVCALVGLALFWTVVGGVVLGILGVIFGFIGRGRVKKNQADNGAVATAGIAVGAVAVVAGILFAVFVWDKVSQAQEDYERCLDEGTPPSVCESLYDPPDP